MSELTDAERETILEHSGEWVLDYIDELVSQLAAERAKVAELEKSESEAWSKYSELLKDRNALLDQTRIGPLRAEEWQVRAIQAERNLKAEQVKVALAVQTLRKLFYAAEPVADAFTESLFAEVCAVLNQSSDVLAEIRRGVAREERV